MDRESATRKVLRKKDLIIKLPAHISTQNNNIDEIRNCVREIRILDEHEREEKLAVFRKYMSLLQPLFNVRSKIIESIPKFWATVIEYHPKLAHLITEEVTEVLKYLKKLEVNNIDTKNFKISLVFEENPFIENKVLIKELSSCSSHEFVSVTTPVKWKRNPNQDKSRLKTGVGRKRKGESTNFFTWYCDDDREDKHSTMNCFDEMWQNPLTFFIWGVMDIEEDLDDVGKWDIDADTNEDENNRFKNEKRGSEIMEDGNYSSEEDEYEAEEEDAYDNSDLGKEVEEESDEDMDDYHQYGEEV